jgi:hypothetical protein
MMTLPNEGRRSNARGDDAIPLGHTIATARGTARLRWLRYPSSGWFGGDEGDDAGGQIAPPALSTVDPASH